MRNKIIHIVVAIMGAIVVFTMTAFICKSLVSDIGAVLKIKDDHGE